MLPFAELHLSANSFTSSLIDLSSVRLSLTESSSSFDSYSFLNSKKALCLSINFLFGVFLFKLEAPAGSSGSPLSDALELGG